RGGGVSNRPTSIRCQRIELDRQGKPFAMWADDSVGTWEVYLRQWNGMAWVGVGGSDADGGLSRGTGVDGSSGYYSCPGHLGFDSQNRPYVVWMNYDGNLQSVHVRRWSGGTWEELGGSASGTGISAGQFAYWPKIVIDVFDRVTVMWTRGSGLYARRWEGSAWAELAGSASGAGIAGPSAMVYIFSAAPGPDGAPYVAWMDERSAGPGSEIRLLSWTGSVWQGLGSSNADGGITGASSYVTYPSVADDGSGRPAVAWHQDEPDGGTSVHLTRWNGSSWSPLPSPTASGSRPVLAVNPAGELYLLWEERIPNGTTPRLAQWTSDGWEDCPLGFVDTGRSTWPALALGPDGQAAVSWFEEVTPGVLQAYVVANLAPWVDAGSAVDAGDGGTSTVPRAYRVGCDCSQGAGAVPFVLLAMLVFFSRRQRSS
ncbi:MAG: hypothetical protein ACOZIN_02140, partial [Myxococcota bacterium]